MHASAVNMSLLNILFYLLFHFYPAFSSPAKYVECADPPFYALSHQDGKGVSNELVDVLNSDVKVRGWCDGDFDSSGCVLYVDCRKIGWAWHTPVRNYHFYAFSVLIVHTCPSVHFSSLFACVLGASLLWSVRHCMQPHRQREGAGLTVLGGAGGVAQGAARCVDRGQETSGVCQDS